MDKTARYLIIGMVAFFSVWTAVLAWYTTPTDADECAHRMEYIKAVDQCISGKNECTLGPNDLILYAQYQNEVREGICHTERRG